MGLYTKVWKQYLYDNILNDLPSVISSKQEKKWDIPSELFENIGNRKKSGYNVNVTFENGKCQQNLDGSAVARGLRDVIEEIAQSSKYHDLFNKRTITMKMNKYFVFSVECKDNDKSLKPSHNSKSKKTCPTKKSSLPPIVDEQSEILILGTMPGDKSLETREYYADSGNIFWKIISNIYNEGKDFFTYEEKEECIKNNHIAIWDVLRFCEREGSTDNKIKKDENTQKNDINKFLLQHPNIKKIVFNGGRALSEYKPDDIQFSVALSTSPSNRQFSEKERTDSWKKALQFKK